MDTFIHNSGALYGYHEYDSFDFQLDNRYSDVIILYQVILKSSEDTYVLINSSSTNSLSMSIGLNSILAVDYGAWVSGTDNAFSSYFVTSSNMSMKTPVVSVSKMKHFTIQNLSTTNVFIPIYMQISSCTENTKLHATLYTTSIYYNT